MAWLILSVFSWGLLHSFLASNRGKELARHLFGATFMRAYRLFYNLLSCVSFMPVLTLAAFTPDKRLYLVPLPWSGLMIAGQVLAIAALLAGLRQTDIWEFLGFQQMRGKRSNDSEANREPENHQAKLVTGGLYRYVRHPLYSAGLAFIWLLPLMTINVLCINIALSLYTIAGAVFEERKLKLKYGQAYIEYMASTPMFVPFARWNKSRNRSSM
jgi:methanethiol S-methyltransferase